MYLEIAQIGVKAGSEEDFARSMSSAAPYMQRARGCRSLEIRRSVETPSMFRLLIMWDSIEDHVAFRSNPDAEKFLAILERCAVSKASDHNVKIYPKE